MRVFCIARTSRVQLANTTVIFYLRRSYIIVVGWPVGSTDGASQTPHAKKTPPEREFVAASPPPVARLQKSNAATVATSHDLHPRSRACVCACRRTAYRWPTRRACVYTQRAGCKLAANVALPLQVAPLVLKWLRAHKKCPISVSVIVAVAGAGGCGNLFC